MKKHKIGFSVFFLLQMAYAQNLADVYSQAVAHDPAYLQIQSQSLSKEEQLAIDRALLLPSVSLSGGYSYSDLQSSWGDTQNFSIALSQPLFDFSKWTTVDGDRFVKQQARYETAAALQDLMLRVAIAYFDVAKSEELLALKQQQLDVQQRLYDEAIKRYEAGQIIATDVSNSKVAYLNSVTSLIEAKTALSNNKSALQKITGNAVLQVNVLKSDFKFISPAPNQVNAWLDKAKEDNLTVKAKQYAMQASRQDIASQRAGHYPVVTGNADYSVTDQNPGTNQHGTTVGVNVSLPLFQGGGVTAKTRQATYNYEAQSEALQLAFEDAFDKVRVNFTTIVNNLDELDAEQKTVEAQKRALRNTEISYQAGLRQMTDVINAENAYFSAQADYINTKYQFMGSVFKLKEASGSLSVNDILMTNRWLS